MLSPLRYARWSFFGGMKVCIAAGVVVEKPKPARPRLPLVQGMTDYAVAVALHHRRCWG